MYILMWRNRWSGDEGFVAKVSIKDKHFVNTFNKNEAHVYKNQLVLKQAMEQLQKFGECQNNEFFPIQVA